MIVAFISGNYALLL